MDDKEFKEHLIELKARLTNFALSLTSNSDDAFDLVQDTFLKALMHRNQFNEDTSLQAWTFTIMRNTFINNFRRKKNHATSIDSSENQFLINSQSMHESADSMYSYKLINNKVNELSAEFRLPFQMHVGGYKYEEIACKLGLKVGTVKSRIFFCRKKLMLELKEYTNERSSNHNGSSQI